MAKKDLLSPTEVKNWEYAFDIQGNKWKEAGEGVIVACSSPSMVRSHVILSVKFATHHQFVNSFSLLG